MYTRRNFLSVALLFILVALTVQAASAQDTKPIEPFYILHSKMWQGVDLKKGKSPLPFECAERQIQKMIDLTVQTVHDADMILPTPDERQVEEVAKRILLIDV